MYSSLSQGRISDLQLLQLHCYTCQKTRQHRERDHMVVRFTYTSVIGANTEVHIKILSYTLIFVSKYIVGEFLAFTSISLKALTPVSSILKMNVTI